MGKKLFILFVTILVSYVGFCLFMYQQQDEMLYQPVTKRTLPIDVQAEAANIVEVMTSDAIKLQGWHFDPIDPQKPTIIFFHGNGWSVGQSFAHVRFLIGAGYGLFMVEYRGYSGHKGKVTEDGLYKDARAYINWLKSVRGISPQDMIFYGESLGSAVAIKMSAEYQPKATFVLSAFSSMQDVAWNKYPYVPVPFLLRDKYKNLNVVGDIQSPILFLHGRRDTLVPYEFAQKLYEGANQPKEMVVYEEGTHTNLLDLGGREKILDFLKNL